MVEWSGAPGLSAEEVAARKSYNVRVPSPGKCDHDRVISPIFFAMTGERKIAPMASIFGTNAKNVATDGPIHGEIPNIDNSDAGVAYPVKRRSPTQNVEKCKTLKNFLQTQKYKNQ